MREKKNNIFFLASIDVEVNGNEEKICRICKNASIVKKYRYDLKKYNGNTSPVIVGMGPAGLFAALILAQSGAKPIVIERGRDVDSRTKDINDFWTSGRLNTSSRSEERRVGKECG